ncbi:hypothetical protein SCLCIDRAFT_542377 [Scleroderma citrinum Foug A]|uniref:DUF3074 domain-containing protein n=1 Tax=Scleroderma citrinum Foug A TaxID=1036808 RepID=A0A0C2ZV08_9AGAM|nr:hypothetical protein SCLCIDRAFT_542377 [Scleroderma citrinum Foug A]
MTFQLTNRAVKLEDVPPEDAILALGGDLIGSTDTWRKGKSFAKGKVLTLHLPRNQAPDKLPWHCRVSRHSKEDATFDEFWSKLGVNKPENERQFISAIKQIVEVKHISQTQSIWSYCYTYPPPVSPRIFTVLLTTHLNNTTPRTGTIVSIPIDLSQDHELAKLEGKGTKGRYVAVERIVELENGEVEWRMATSGTPGGMIPSFITESSMPGQIAADVTQFLGWLPTTRDRTATNT